MSPEGRGRYLSEQEIMNTKEVDRNWGIYDITKNQLEILEVENIHMVSEI